MLSKSSEQSALFCYDIGHKVLHVSDMCDLSFCINGIKLGIRK